LITWNSRPIGGTELCWITFEARGDGQNGWLQ
jgi:hypothetical protein